MITDRDILKLAKVFATKEDLIRMESGIRRDMATKDDLKGFATKDDLVEMRDGIIDVIKEEVLKIYELLGEQSDNSDTFVEEQRGHRIALGDHEKRLGILEHR